MSSSVYFKFKSQKDPQRVTFDGTGISVFELKKNIIDISKLGDGTDFDLLIYNQDTEEEYDDDTTIIPRSTSVIVRRLPAAKPGQGRAARYVKGSMPVNARVPHRPELSKQPFNAASKASRPSHITSTSDVGQTEQERIRAMLEMGGAEWEKEKQQMATASRVPISGFNKNPATKSTHPPPPGYRCYRCGLEGHWIQECPTNNDPSYDGQKKKRVTGIPRSQLKSVTDVPSSVDDGFTDEARQPTSVLVNADGERVIAVPDTASWQQYQEKAQASAAQKEKAASSSKELRERGLECSIDNRLFVNPVKTPCCGKTFCYDCIDAALADNDLVCPNCSTEQVFLEDLAPDEEMINKIRAYEEEKKKAEKVNAEKANAEKDFPEKASAEKASAQKTHMGSMKGDVSETSGLVVEDVRDSRTPTPAPAVGVAKKRAAEEDLKNDRKPESPASMERTNSNTLNQEASAAKPQMKPPSSSDLDFVKQMDALAGTQTTVSDSSATPATSLPPFSMNMDLNMNMPLNMPGMPNMPFLPPQMQTGSFQMPPGFNMMGLNPMSMNQMSNMPMQQMPAFPQWNMGSNPAIFGQGMYPPGNMNNNNMFQNQQFPQQSWPGTGANRNQQNQYPQQIYGGNQQFQNSGPPFQTQYNQNGQSDDDAYMRKPVNPHRHHPGKQQNKPRPTDYKELG